VLVAAYVTSAFPMERCFVAPAYRHPFGKSLGASFEDRVAMCRLAFRDLRRVEVTDVEATLGGEGYTLRLVEALRAREPGASFRLVIGTDLLGETHRWHEWERVAKLAPPLVVARAGSDQGTAGPKMPDVRSSKIRRSIASGESVAGYVPNAVIGYIEEHGLYATTA
jgi:nicotinate-nucleotide adenylyltransferase